jgi:hypothetical protein
MYTLFMTPDYLSTRGSRCTAAGQADFGPDATCVGPADPCEGKNNFMWGCDPPFDIDAIPGSGLADGTDQNFKWFVTAMMTHMRANSESVQYWEVWNEPNILTEWNHPPVKGDLQLAQFSAPAALRGPSGAPTCTGPGLAENSGPGTATVAELVRFARDSRAIIAPVFPKIQLSAPPVTNPVVSSNYLSQLLAAGGSQFDDLGFHGYYDANGACCPTNCPTPEYFVASWNALVNVVNAAGLSSKPVLDTEFSWGEYSGVINPDMRAAQSARIYLLHESYYPALARVIWFGEDSPVDYAPNPYNNNNPIGGEGEFWASAATNVADGCTAADPIQGGYDCPAGVAMRQVAKWTVDAMFSGPCSCSSSPKRGSDCSATPATGIWQCAITRPNGYAGLFVWDNTWTTFPCSNAPCGSSTFTIPSAYTGDWQDLDGNLTPLNGATSVLIGAKPILIETQ